MVQRGLLIIIQPTPWLQPSPLQQRQTLQKKKKYFDDNKGKSKVQVHKSYSFLLTCLAEKTEPLTNYSRFFFWDSAK